MNGLIHVTAVDAEGCVATDTINIQIGQVTADIGNDTTLCGSGSLTLDAGAGAGGSPTYLWNTGATTQSIVSTIAGDYSVLMTTNIGCIDRDTITVTFSSPVVNLGNDISICQGSIVTLDAGNPGATYLWTDQGSGQTTQIVTGTTAGEYHVYVTDIHGCQGADTVIVAIHTTPTGTVDPSFQTNYDIADGDINLAFGQPTGGTYAGTAVTGGVFNTTGAGNGTHVITYTFTDVVTGCTGTADTTLVVSTTTSVSGIENGSELKVAPNPFTNQFRVVMTNTSLQSSYTLVSSNGNEVTSGVLNSNGSISSATISGQGLALGVYYLIVKNEQGMVATKVVKTR